jgi:hypothetical protein
MAHQAAASTSQAAPCASSPTGVSVIHHGQRVDEKLSAEQVRSKVLRQVSALFTVSYERNLGAQPTSCDVGDSAL